MAQYQLAKAMGISPPLLSKIEKGTATLTIQNATALGKALKFTRDERLELSQLMFDATASAPTSSQQATNSVDREPGIVIGLPQKPDAYVEYRFRQRTLRRICKGGRVALVHGMPGSGKTTLVSHFVRAIVADDQAQIDRSVWLDMARGGAIDGTVLCAAILEGLGESYSDLDDSSPGVASVVARDALERRPTVLVLDRFDAVLQPDGRAREDVEALLQTLASCETTLTVIISRRRVASPYIGRRRTLHVMGLPKKTGLQLASTLFPAAAEDVASLFARRVAYHPLAMIRLRQYVDAARIGVEDLVADDHVWQAALRQVSGAILEGTELSPEQVSTVRMLFALRLPLNPTVASYGRLPGVDNTMDVLASLESVGLVYYRTGWIPHPVACVYAHDQHSEASDYRKAHSVTSQMYETAIARFRDKGDDSQTNTGTNSWLIWAFECVYHCLMAQDATRAGEVMDKYQPTHHYIENGRVDDVHALWTLIKANAARYEPQSAAAGVRSVLAHLPDLAVEDIAIAALCVSGWMAAYDLMAYLRDERARTIEGLIGVSIRYAGIMCLNGAANVAARLMHETQSAFDLVQSRATPALQSAALLMQARIAFEQGDATGAIKLCDETIEECARYQRERQAPAGDKKGAGAQGLVGKLWASTFGSGHTASYGPVEVDSKLIAKIPAYARCMRAVCLFALGQHNEAYAYFDETLSMVRRIEALELDMRIFILDHYATCLMVGREWERALAALQDRLAIIRGWQNEARAALVRWPDAFNAQCVHDIVTYFYERAYCIEVRLSAGDYAGAEQDARAVRHELLSRESTVETNLRWHPDATGMQRHALQLVVCQRSFCTVRVPGSKL